MKPRQVQNGGRKSKGDRRVFTTRLPADLAQMVEDASDADDLALSEVIGNAVAKYFDRPPIATAGPARQMQLTA